MRKTEPLNVRTGWWVALLLTTVPFEGFAQGPVDWPRLAEEHDHLGRVVLHLVARNYAPAYQRVHYRDIHDLFLLAAIPVDPAGRPRPNDYRQYFQEERPSTVLVTSVPYQNPYALVPTESALVWVRLLNANTLVFRCQLFDPGPSELFTCQGTYDIDQGFIEFKFNDLLISRAARRLEGDDEECRDGVYEAEIQRQECRFRSNLISQFNCFFVSKLYANDQCNRT